MQSGRKRIGRSNLTPGEIALLSLLSVIGLVGGWCATRQLGALRLELQQARLHHEGEIARLRAAKERQRQAETAAEASPPLSPRSSELAPVEISRTERTGALLHLAQIVSRDHRQGSLNRRQQSIIRAHARAKAAGADLADLPQPAYLVSPEGQLPARFGELFMLNDDDVIRLQHALDTAKSSVEQLAFAGTQVKDHGNETYSFDQPGVPDELIAVERERMLAAFKQVLGEDAYNAFVVLNGESSDPAVAQGGPAAFLGSFGSVGRAVVISKTSAGKYRYQMLHGTTGRAKGEASSREDLQKKVGAAAKMLPSGF